MTALRNGLQFHEHPAVIGWWCRTFGRALVWLTPPARRRLLLAWAAAAVGLATTVSTMGKYPALALPGDGWRLALVVIAQFALLATSDFIPTANFGLMTAVGLLAGQAAELLLLPALLVLRDGRKPRVQRSPAGHQRALPSGMRMPAPSETLWPPAEQPSSGLEAPQEVAPTPPSPTVAPTGLVLVCRGEVCRAKGSETVWEQCRDAYVMAKATGRPLQAVPVESPCLRRCEHAPVVLLANDPSAMDADDVDVLATLAKAAMTQRGGAT